jgi:hypothetical protein
MLQDQIGPVFLAMLSVAFGVYGARELLLACRPWPLDQWIERVLPAAGGIALSALFACCSYKLVEMTAEMGGVVAWALY